MTMIKRIKVLSVLLCGALCFASLGSWAQTTSPAVVKAGEANQPADPTTLLLAAQKVILLIDQGLASQLWQHVSTITQKAMTEEEFTRSVYASRRPLGAVINRRWAAIAQIEHAGSESTPAGVYVTVSFITNFAGKTGLREQVTFRQDEDGVWRIAGYAL